jgi:hypothetical protein
MAFAATLPGRGPGAGQRPGSRDPHDQAAYRALSTPSLHRIQTQNECVLDTGHDHDPSAARTQMFYV